MTLDFSAVANGKPKAIKKEKTKFVMLTPTAPQIEPIQKEFDKYKPQLIELGDQAKALKVTDSETFQIAVDGASMTKGLIKAIKGRWEELSAPFREFINKGNNIIKLYTNPFKTIADEYSRKSGDYQYQLDLARERQQKAIDEANKKLQEDLNKQAKKDGIKAPVVTPVKAPKRETVIHTAGGHSQHLRKQWVGEIEDGEKVPRNYCVPDQKLINQAIRMGVREIPGVKIFEKVSAVHR